MYLSYCLCCSLWKRGNQKEIFCSESRSFFFTDLNIHLKTCLSVKERLSSWQDCKYNYLLVSVLLHVMYPEDPCKNEWTWHSITVEKCFFLCLQNEKTIHQNQAVVFMSFMFLCDKKRMTERRREKEVEGRHYERIDKKKNDQEPHDRRNDACALFLLKDKVNMLRRIW